MKIYRQLEEKEDIENPRLIAIEELFVLESSLADFSIKSSKATVKKIRLLFGTKYS